MDYKDWVVLKTIKEERSLTKAAQRLFISQPALSHRLQNLEKDIGVRILNRYSNGVCFTQQGLYLVKYSEEMLERLEAVKKHVCNMTPSVSGTLRLGVSRVFARYKMAPLLKSYHKHFPNVDVSLKTGSSTLTLPAMLQNNELDVAILRGGATWPENTYVLFEEPMCITASQPIILKQLPKTQWIQYDVSALTKTEDEQYLWWQEQFNCPLPPIIKVDSIDACLQMVSHGLGWCIVPKLHISNFRSLFSCPVTFRDGHTLLRKTVMMYNNNTVEQPVTKTFIDFILREYPA
ncbi:MAG: hypothetical protein H6Q72_2174 [Firmicutes bacterium]|nr:hypothetical protein [Bacillota bacterium]